MGPRILSIYPTKSSTRAAFFEGGKETGRFEANHDPYILDALPTLEAKSKYRLDGVEKLLSERVSKSPRLDAVIGEGILTPKMPRGVYNLDEKFVEMLRRTHKIGKLINCGALLAFSIASSRGARAFALGSFACDEFDARGRISGIPGLKFGNMTQVISMKNAVRLASEELGKAPGELSAVIAYLGRTFSFCAHSEGRILDFTNALERGPFTPVMSGSLPASEVVRKAYSGAWAKLDLIEYVSASGGLKSYSGTEDIGHVIESADEGDMYSALVIRAMIYQIAAELGALATTLKGRVDAVILSGYWAHHPAFGKMLEEKVSWISGRVLFCRLEDELASIASAALSVLNGAEVLRRLPE